MPPWEPRKHFPISDLMLSVTMRGTLGQYGIGCALGLSILPLTLDAAIGRGEWGDIIAKMRGMRLADILFRWPVVRQYCGCRVCADPRSDAGDMLAGDLVVRLCERHAWPGRAGAGDEAERPTDVIVLGELRYRDSRDADHPHALRFGSNGGEE